MRITSLILALVTAGALATFGQEGAVETVKQGAKKTGQKIKEGVETVGEKTKKAAETVGEKTKETAQTVGKKTKEAVETTGEKTTESTKTAHSQIEKSREQGQKQKRPSSNRQAKRAIHLHQVQAVADTRKQVVLTKRALRPAVLRTAAPGARAECAPPHSSRPNDWT